MMEFPTVTLGQLIEDYEVLLFDASGVLVDAQGALPGAVEAIACLNRIHKSYFVLTNDASKLPETRVRRYLDYGLEIPQDRIIASGSLLIDWFQRQGLQGAVTRVLGPADSRRFVEMAGGVPVQSGEDYQVLAIADQSGFPLLETLDSVLGTLCRRIDSGAPVSLVLPNPDLIYPKAQGGFGFAAGSLARMFEQALELRYPDRRDLVFDRLGKPGTALFQAARERVGEARMVMIGDQLQTDILGANRFGIDSALIQSGVNRALSEGEGAPVPTYVMGSLVL